ncbi:hypothetical protein N7540_009524 [Penicillium herquei]|nr:hypothetical protein N7540_009524 [Penicillium herquei]
MQYKISALGAILAASSSVLAAPVGLLSPDNAINAVNALTAKTSQLHSDLSATLSSQEYSDIAQTGLEQLVEQKIEDNAEFGLAGDIEGLVGFTTFSQEQEQELCNQILDFVNVDVSFLQKLIALEESIESVSSQDTVLYQLEGDRSQTNVLLNALPKYAPSCAGDITSKIAYLESVEKEAIQAYSTDNRPH